MMPPTYDPTDDEDAREERMRFWVERECEAPCSEKHLDVAGRVGGFTPPPAIQTAPSERHWCDPLPVDSPTSDADLEC